MKEEQNYQRVSVYDAVNDCTLHGVRVEVQGFITSLPPSAYESIRRGDISESGLPNPSLEFVANENGEEIGEVNCPGVDIVILDIAYDPKCSPENEVILRGKIRHFPGDLLCPLRWNRLNVEAVDQIIRSPMWWRL